MPTAAARAKCKSACTLTMGSIKLVISEVGSEGTTPHLVGVEPLRMCLCETTAKIQALYDYEKYSIPSIPQVPQPNFEVQKMPETIFLKLFHFLPHVLVFVGIYLDFVVNPPQTALLGFSSESRPVSRESLCGIL